ncbi:replication protein B [Yersinia ruckeri]|nr:replication protein B [Yersinia ruckeri]EKN4693357.1 replication protein B [Yersinia ruckeri]
MSQCYAFTAENVRSIPPHLRALIGAYFADSRWQDTCKFYNNLPSRYRATICFHAELKKRHSLLRMEEMNEPERERLVGSINELRQCLAKYRKHQISNIAFIQRQPLSVRKTLFLHAGLTSVEFKLPIWHIENANCYWREALLEALRELLNIFDDAPTIITSVKPEAYVN